MTKIPLPSETTNAPDHMPRQYRMMIVEGEANRLARLLEEDLGVKVNPMGLARFISDRWATIHGAAHNIHDLFPEPDEEAHNGKS